MVLQITPAERSALEVLANGNATQDIAGCLGTTEAGLQERLALLFARLGVASGNEAVTVAKRRGLLPSA